MIGSAYLIFMSMYAPHGIDWFSWYFYRIFNLAEYLRFNGYLSSYGFSIWTTCQDCNLSAEPIYLSENVFRFAPYILINHLWGKEGLQIYGPIISCIAIFVSATSAAELIVKCVKNYSKIALYFVGVAGFTLFLTAPWTYRMLLQPWAEVYFLMFTLLALLSFSNHHNRLACLLLFVAGLTQYQWAIAVAMFYVLLTIIPYLTKDRIGSNDYIPPVGSKRLGQLAIIASLLVPAAGYVVLRFILQQNFEYTFGSSLLTRIGISGHDIHNGGLLGALQFLGGNRITLCVQDYILGNTVFTPLKGISMYNCILSIAGMGLLSILSIFGLCTLLKKSQLSKWIILPLAYALLIFITFLQQSTSAHLLGYSYVFSFLFAAGIASLVVFVAKYIGSSTLSVVLATPCLIGIIILSIRVSMLTEVVLDRI
tara:strand:+ start:569 stop:1840 length:1272 start_codon:yes stop_codon:yes gene_type:complete